MKTRKKKEQKEKDGDEQGVGRGVTISCFKKKRIHIEKKIGENINTPPPQKKKKKKKKHPQGDEHPCWWVNRTVHRSWTGGEVFMKRSGTQPARAPPRKVKG